MNIRSIYGVYGRYTVDICVTVRWWQFAPYGLWQTYSHHTTGSPHTPTHRPHPFFSGAHSLKISIPNPTLPNIFPSHRRQPTHSHRPPPLLLRRAPLLCPPPMHQPHPTPTHQQHQHQQQHLCPLHKHTHHKRHTRPQHHQPARSAQSAHRPQQKRVRKQACGLDRSGRC